MPTSLGAVALALLCLSVAAAAPAGAAARLRSQPLEHAVTASVASSVLTIPRTNRPCEAGDDVVARKADGRLHKARLVSVNGDGTAAVAWHDGDALGRIVDAVDVKKRNGLGCGLIGTRAVRKAAHAESSNGNGTGFSQHGGVVHFLFLVHDGVPHAELWKKFFDQAPFGSYTALAHCKDEAACKSKGNLGIPGLLVVETTPTWYCHDLVTAMARLLSTALTLKAAPAGVPEKFVFLSDSTLPVKPFAEVHEALMSDGDSDFCVFPKWQWGKATIEGHDLAIVKHHQWVVLSRPHAEAFVEKWVPVDSNGLWRVWLRDGPFEGHERWVSPFVFLRPATSNSCADEWAFMATIFGAVEAHYYYTPPVTLPGFGGGPLQLAGKLAHVTQGRCRTFSFWDESDGEAFGALAAELHAAQDISCYPRCVSRPASFERLGAASLQAMRDSEFLFARKFSPTAQLPDFERIVLGR